MASVLEYTVSSLDTENLLEQRVKLNQLDVLDPELKTNLQFAISAMDKLPNTLKKNAELVVEGEKTLVKIRAGRPSLRCVVFQGHEGTVLHQTIHVNRELLPEHIHEAFFIGHDCPHGEPCWMQARTALKYHFKGQFQINIICKEVRVTFSSPEPEVIITFPTQEK